jgi:ATP-binding cassette subfamily C protein
VRTPTLLQMEAVECGAVALGIVLAYHGRIVPLPELRRECGISRDGSNAANLVKAARRYGLVARGYSREVQDLHEIEMPCIVFWNFNHFVVVEGFARNAVHINDPALGHRRITPAEFEESFTGVVLAFSPGPEFRRGGAWPSVGRSLRRRLSGMGGALAFAVLTGFLLVLPGLSFAAFTQVFLDEILIQGQERWLRGLCLAMVVMALIQALLKWLQLSSLRHLRLALAARGSARFFRHLLRLPIDFYSQRYAGEVSARSALEARVAGVLSGQLAQTVIDVVMVGFYAAAMFLLEARLTWFGIASAALNFVALRKLSSWRVEANMRLLQDEGKLAGLAIAGLQNIETIKASGLEAGFFRRWAGHQAKASNARTSIDCTNELLSLLPDLLGSLTNVGVLVVGSLYVIDGRLTIGSLVAFRILMGSFLRPVTNLVRLGGTLQELRGDLARLDDVLEQAADPLALPTLAPPADVDAPLRLRGELELREVTFGYNPMAPPLLSGFSLSLRPGQKIALVGGSGSGKSTIANLVCGLYQPWSGEILFDGSPRGEVPAAVLANSLARVDQDLLLFEGSVRDNLTLWDPTVPVAQLERTCREAEILGAVRGLGGVEGELAEDGTNLSGGERQRLEIARALVNDPSILVLDEATSALDAESERAVVEHITQRGCACLIVAHRLSTIRDCDEIIVLERGQVVERGTHAELWRQGGAYARLIRVEGEMLEGAG